MHDAADNTSVVDPLDTPYVRRQMALNLLPLHIAQPKEVLAHAPDPPKNESGAYGIRIALSQQQK